MFKSFRESSAVCTLADRQLEQAINAKLERGRVAVYSTPSSYGLVFTWKGRNHTVEQEARLTLKRSPPRLLNGLTSWRTPDCQRAGAGRHKSLASLLAWELANERLRANVP